MEDPRATPTAEAEDKDILEDEVVDYSVLLSGASQTTLVRGTKDYAPDGSERQRTAIESSRAALQQVLLEERRASTYERPPSTHICQPSTCLSLSIAEV
ncbi:hypothetical protein HK104_003718 [Borealophlyctis nickersoniae]|nr:hypothetical protein HK104_003718 [Borealophlyctis nickersoniae]